MKIKRILVAFFLLGLLCFAPTVKAQVLIERSAEIVSVSGKEYYMHYVRSGETLEEIAKVYQVSVQEIERLNPELKDGIKVGYVLGIPVRINQPVLDEPILEPVGELETEVVEEPVVEPKEIPVVIEEEVLEKEPVEEPVVEPKDRTEMARDTVIVVRSTELTKIGNKEYYLHQVKAGETLYGISKAYQVSVEEIERLNPEVKNGLKAGSIIGILAHAGNGLVEKPVVQPEEPVVEPVVTVEEPKIEPVEPQQITPQEGNVTIVEPVTIERSAEVVTIQNKKYYLHRVKSGETLYSLSKAYQVSIEEIERLNPEVKDGLKEGAILGIVYKDLPNSEVTPVEEPEIVPIEEPVVVVEEPEVTPIEEPVVVIEEPKVTPIEEPVVVVEEPEVTPIEEPVVVIEEPKVTPIEEPVVVIEEPEVTPIEEPVVVIEEPEVTPIEEPVVVIEEPEVTPIEEPVVVQEEVPVVVVPEKEKIEPVEVVLEGGRYVVQSNEDLYDIAKKLGIDLADFKALNPGLTNNPAVGTSILVPNIVNENDYILHKVEKSERTTVLLKRWKVSESDFRAKNVSVGSMVFSNQIVLIPIDPVSVKMESVAVVPEVTEPTEPVAEVEPTEPEELPYLLAQCDAAPENINKHYEVALLMPLYLYEVGDLAISKENMSRIQKSKALSFLQFYEGFMMAVETLTRQHGLKLDLTVMDVTDNVATAHDALSRIKKKDWDMIVGPFFSKSFDVIEEYAKEQGIIVVNPLSNRESVVEGNTNVVKVKPNLNGVILELSTWVKKYYRDANIFIVSREKAADTLFLNRLEKQLNLAVNEEVLISNDEFIEFARSESERMEMGSKMVSTITVEGQVFSVKDLENSAMDGVVLHNSVKRFNTVGSVVPHLSGVRENIIIAYGEDNVFATQTLNGLKRTETRYPITLVAIPDWSRFEKLLVDNLLQLKAVYVSDGFVDYNDEAVKRFVRQFRSKYSCEPQEYAFEGYDLAWYFLKALMNYGSDMVDCLPGFNIPLLHTQYYFMNKGRNNGVENQYWSLYQYDKEAIELKPINPFK